MCSVDCTIKFKSLKSNVKLYWEQLNEDEVEMPDGTIQQTMGVYEDLKSFPFVSITECLR